MIQASWKGTGDRCAFPHKPTQNASGWQNPHHRAAPFSMFSLNIERANIFVGEKIKFLAESSCIFTNLSESKGKSL